MGNLIHPTSFRLGATKFWNNTWALSSMNNYSFMTTKNILVMKYLEKLLKKISTAYFKKGLLFTSIKTLEIYNRFVVLIYFKFDDLVDFSSSINKIVVARIKDLQYKKKTLKVFNFKFPNIFRGRRGNRRQFVKVPKIKKKLKLNIRLMQNKSVRKYILDLRDVNFRSTLGKTDAKAAFWGSMVKFEEVSNFIFSSRLKSKELSTFMNKEIFKYVFYSSIFKKLKLFLYKCINKLNVMKNNRLEIMFTFFNWSAITAGMLARFIVFRLQQKFPVRSVIGNLLKQLRHLQKVGAVVGFKVTCSGRFARRGRASFIWKHTGKIGDPVLDLDVDYSLLLVTLTNSICGIKVWITRSKQTSKLLYI